MPDRSNAFILELLLMMAFNKPDDTLRVYLAIIDSNSKFELLTTISMIFSAQDPFQPVRSMDFTEENNLLHEHSFSNVAIGKFILTNELKSKVCHKIGVEIIMFRQYSQTNDNLEKDNGNLFKCLS